MELLKNGLGGPAVERIAYALEQVKPDFERTNFVSEAMAGLDILELKERVSQVIRVLHEFLPREFTLLTD